MKNQTWIKTVMTTGLALLVVGCGDPFKRHSDPMTEYEELRDDIPRAQYKVNNQNFDGVLFDLQFLGQADGSQLNFYEGTSTSYNLQARVFISGVSYTLIPHNFPKGVSLQKVANESDIWVLKWTPETNTIPSGLTNKTFEAQIEFALDQNTTARARESFNLDRRNRVKTVTLSVNFSSSQPVLTVTGLDSNKVLKFGDVVPLTIEVVDPNSNAQRKPRVIAEFDIENQSAEARTFPANNTIIHDNKKKDKFAGNGKWIIYRLLDTTLIPKEYLDARAKYEAGEFTISAINTAKLEATQLKRFKVQAKEVVQ